MYDRDVKLVPSLLSYMPSMWVEPGQACITTSLCCKALMVGCGVKQHSIVILETGVACLGPDAIAAVPKRRQLKPLNSYPACHLAEIA